MKAEGRSLEKRKRGESCGENSVEKEPVPETHGETPEMREKTLRLSYGRRLMSVI